MLKEVVEEVVWSRKCKQSSQIRYRFRVTTVLRRCLFYYCDCRFLESGNISFNVACELIWLVAIKDRKEANSALCSIFSLHLRVGLLFEYFSVRLVGTCHACYRYYCPSLITALQLSVVPWTLNPESPLNDHKIQSDIDVKTSLLRNGDDSEKKSYLHVLLQMISPATPSDYIVIN
jgi:hypothetical protein